MLLGPFENLKEQEEGGIEKEKEKKKKKVKKKERI